MAGRPRLAFEGAAEWKAWIPREMKRRTTATNPWWAVMLKMGHPGRVGNLIKSI
jgi:hypothetical protein